MMKNSVLNQSRNFAQNTHVGQMLSNMRGQATHTVQQSRNWIWTTSTKCQTNSE